MKPLFEHAHPFLFPGMPSIGFPSQTGTSVYSVALCKIVYFLWMALVGA